MRRKYKIQKRRKYKKKIYRRGFFTGYANLLTKIKKNCINY